jgi:hypothetical protein
MKAIIKQVTQDDRPPLGVCHVEEAQPMDGISLCGFSSAVIKEFATNAQFHSLF